MWYGPAVGVVVICCLPPGSSANGLEPSCTSVSFGAPDGEAGEDGGESPGGIALQISQDRSLLLKPVRVRRDASPRWSDGAAVASLSDPIAEPGGGDRLMRKWIAGDARTEDINENLTDEITPHCTPAGRAAGAVRGADTAVEPASAWGNDDEPDSPGPSTAASEDEVEA